MLGWYCAVPSLLLFQPGEYILDAGPNLVNALVAPIRAAGEVEPKIAIAVPLGQAHCHVLLPPRRCCPIGRHRALLHDRLLIFIQRLCGNRRDTGVELTQLLALFASRIPNRNGIK